MALDATRLKNNLKSAIESNVRAEFSLSGSIPDLTKYCNALADAIAQAVITEIDTNAELSGIVTGSPGSSLTGGIN